MFDIFISDAQLPEDPLWLIERPPWREELLRAYVEEFAPPGALLLDPFARHPALLRVAQSSGQRVLAANFDPLPLLCLRLTLSPPEPRALDTIFSRLADAPKAGEPLFRHLSDLYRTQCPACHRALSAEYFIWEGEAPVEKGFHCPHCGEAGTAPTDPHDLDLLAAVEEKGAIYWWLRQRLARPMDMEVKRAEELLDLYTPRNRYALGELILQAESLFSVGEERALEAIRALCLACLQRCHSLHTAPDQTFLPRTLHRPRRFVERNVWQTFEAAYRKLRSQPRVASPTWASDLTALLEPRPGPGFGQALTLQCTTRRLTAALKRYPRLPFICTDPPRPDPAAYALAFLWSGWLFGREATLPLRPLLRQRSVDWAWYTEAMSGVFQTLSELLAGDGRLLLAFTAEQEAWLPALLLAAARTDLTLEHSVGQLQGETEKGERIAYRLLFRSRPVYPLSSPREAPREEAGRMAEELAPRLQEEGVKAARAVLEARGEPASASWLRAAIYMHWSRRGLLRDVPQRRWPFEPLSWLMQQLEAVLPPEGPGPEGLLRLVAAAEAKRAPCACWWLADPSAAAEPLSERVERAVADLLRSTRVWPQMELLDELCRRFRGLLTPERPLLEACIASYGQELTPGHWQLRPEDGPEARAEAHCQMVRLLVQLGRQLGFDVWWAAQEEECMAAERWPAGGKGRGVEPKPEWAPCVVVWHEGGLAAHGFALSDTAALSPWLEPPPPTLGELPRYIVVPGGRSGLLAFKLRRCPEWRRRLVAYGWTFVKYRHLRRLAEMEDLDRAGWRARIGLDPVVERREEQLALF